MQRQIINKQTTADAHYYHDMCPILLPPSWMPLLQPIRDLSKVVDSKCKIQHQPTPTIFGTRSLILWWEYHRKVPRLFQMCPGIASGNRRKMWFFEILCIFFLCQWWKFLCEDRVCLRQWLKMPKSWGFLIDIQTFKEH